MPLGFLFWLVFILGLAFNGYWGLNRAAGDRLGWFGSSVPVLVLIFLLGWQVFGFVAQR